LPAPSRWCTARADTTRSKLPSGSESSRRLWRRPAAATRSLASPAQLAQVSCVQDRPAVLAVTTGSSRSASFPVLSTSRIARGQLDALSTDIAATGGPRKSSGTASLPSSVQHSLGQSLARNPEKIQYSRNRRDGGNTRIHVASAATRPSCSTGRPGLDAGGVLQTAAGHARTPACRTGHRHVACASPCRACP
jgi:hypothetical protein